MWLITPIGFFSIVQKPSDVSMETLTVRARVRKDLETLRSEYLRGLGEVNESKTNDYRFRATAPRAEVAAAMARLVQTLDYGNFKNQVAKVQGTNRAHLYHDVWDVLYKLQTEPTFSSTGPVFHPHKDENGKPVVLKMPSKPTPLETWAQPTELACVVPGGAMPVALNGIAVSSWDDVPKSAQVGKRWRPTPQSLSRSSKCLRATKKLPGLWCVKRTDVSGLLRRATSSAATQPPFRRERWMESQPRSRPWSRLRRNRV